MKKFIFNVIFAVVLIFLSFSAFSESRSRVISGNSGSKLSAEVYGEFDEPWAMVCLPDGRLLITEKKGNLIIFNTENQSRISVKGVPEVAYSGQGGLGDVVLHPQFSENRLIYLSYAEEGRFGRRGAVVVRGTLNISGSEARFEQTEVIWRQDPFVTGSGHYSHRLAFGPGGYLFITSGERQKQEPAQRWEQNLGKIIRLNDDGSVPADNPFQNRGALAKTFWTVGHRNMLGIAFDAASRLWVHEMGPLHGDELNLIVRGDNYGWPEVSWGNHYSGIDIPDHDTRLDFHSPEVYWIPTIAPAGMIIYSGTMFPQWQGNAFIGGLKSEALIRVVLDGAKAEEAERFGMGKRIREVEQGTDGSIWVLEDKSGGRLLKLIPAP